MLLTNNGSLYFGEKKGITYFASEEFPLLKINCKQVSQVHNFKILSINKCEKIDTVKSMDKLRNNLIPKFTSNLQNADLLVYPIINLKRCTKCILPETMPYIKFDMYGVCNYCTHYNKKNTPKKLEVLELKLQKYKKLGPNCIFPFSGGRDSSFGLHFIVEQLKLNPIAYTYDWGMVTDLGRRNISRMCQELKVENIVVAADISRKRANIRKNLIAWLKNPNLGMVSILTAGDKHFFKYIEKIKLQTKINLNIWSINPLETTHFKSGFLGVSPDFLSSSVYQSGIKSQVKYQTLRFLQMLKSPEYFNTSIFDTLTGEYYRSRSKGPDYFQLFDYYRWDEGEIDSVLQSYSWERALDTTTTWRIGDGTAAFYNYIFHRVAGFTEHDTFRSNQIREGDLSRQKALELIELENLPRYENIKWYLDTLNLNFSEIIHRINQIPRLTSS
jgi:ribosomal protein L33